MLIFASKNFIVESREQPFLPRTDGGHIRILAKDQSWSDRTQLLPAAAIELMRLTMVVGEALQTAMNKRGIPVIKINYQDMGNWAWKNNEPPLLHVHIFGRATNAVKQPWPESMYLPDRKTGFYDGFEPLNAADVEQIQAELGLILQQEKYQDKQWGL
jgi:diadenosine tetraphosphate (Ap4A) HIT family hydrolase